MQERCAFAHSTSLEHTVNPALVPASCLAAPSAALYGYLTLHCLQFTSIRCSYYVRLPSPKPKFLPYPSLTSVCCVSNSVHRFYWTHPVLQEHLQEGPFKKALGSDGLTDLSQPSFCAEAKCCVSMKSFHPLLGQDAGRKPLCSHLNWGLFKLPLVFYFYSVYYIFMRNVLKDSLPGITATPIFKSLMRTSFT